MLDAEVGDELHYQELTGTTSASLPDDLAHFPHSPEAFELCSDSNLRLTLQKVWKPQELELVLYLTNQNQSNASISDVCSTLDPPSNLVALFDCSSENKLQNECIGHLDWVRKFIFLLTIPFALFPFCTLLSMNTVAGLMYEILFYFYFILFFFASLFFFLSADDQLSLCLSLCDKPKPFLSIGSQLSLGHKHAKKELSQYPAILTDQAW